MADHPTADCPVGTALIGAPNGIGGNLRENSYRSKRQTVSPVVT